MTFQAVEKAIAQGLRNRVISGGNTIHLDDVKAVATQRQAGHWASLYIFGKDVPRKAYYAVYEALTASAGLFVLTSEYRDEGFDYGTPMTMVTAYQKELFHFDLLYRHFCEQADISESKTLGYPEKTPENGKYRFEANLGVQLGVLPSYTALGMAAPPPAP